MSSGAGPVVYRSLKQVWDVLSKQSTIEVQNLTALCMKRGLVDVGGGDVTVANKTDFPFIVIEGLDGTGKTTLTRYLSSKLRMNLISTPPKLPEFQDARDYFDSQPESLRRAFYSLGNYLAAQDVVNSMQPVVMDRFWHSTAAYAMAHRLKTAGVQADKSELIWPEDLLRPDLVIFLEVSEEERLRRHGNRKDFTNTEEEKTLAKDEAFRHSIADLYKGIAGPKFLELNVDGDQSSVEAKIFRTVTEHFPSLIKADARTEANQNQ